MKRKTLVDEIDPCAMLKKNWNENIVYYPSVAYFDIVNYLFLIRMPIFSLSKSAEGLQD